MKRNRPLRITVVEAADFKFSKAAIFDLANMWFCATYLRLQASFIVGFSLWDAAFAENRILLEPDYSLHQRPPTDEGQPLLIQVACSIFSIYPSNLYIYFLYFFRRASTCGISWK